MTAACAYACTLHAACFALHLESALVGERQAIGDGQLRITTPQLGFLCCKQARVAALMHPDHCSLLCVLSGPLQWSCARSDFAVVLGVAAGHGTSAGGVKTLVAVGLQVLARRVHAHRLLVGPPGHTVHSIALPQLLALRRLTAQLHRDTGTIASLPCKVNDPGHLLSRMGSSTYLSVLQLG